MCYNETKEWTRIWGNIEQIQGIKKRKQTELKVYTSNIIYTTHGFTKDLLSFVENISIIQYYPYKKPKHLLI